MTAQYQGWCIVKMLDYIAIKTEDKTWGEAIKSTDLTGFLIASLPPIVRPAMRNQIDVIDGRDGDIVTELGYSAYDKPLGIAMYGNYDFQNILDFFKPKGQVIFSNEPDKFYEYQLLDMIQLDRVIKFKKGTVNFHVQPYKYSVSELPLITTSSDYKIMNFGNVESKPIMTVYGSGTVNILLNGVQVLTLTIGNEGYITIDSARLEAYAGTTLKNRQVLGNYENVKLNTGENTISWTGTVTRMEIRKYSRWI